MSTDHDPSGDGRTIAAITLACKWYYFADAAFALIVSSITLILSSIVMSISPRDSTGYPCVYQQLLKVGSAIVFISRCIDVCMGCVYLCSMTNLDRFGRYCMRNLGLSCFQCLMGIANCTFAGLAAIACSIALSWLSVVFGVILFFTAGEELYVWAHLYMMWRGMKDGNGPQFADQFLSEHFPKCILDYIDRHK